MDQGSNKRAYARFEVQDKSLHCKMQFTTEVELLNLSLGGAAIRTRKQLRMGTRYTITLSGTEGLITLKGSVAWEKLSGGEKLPNGDYRPIYMAGIQFDNVFTGKGSSLANFIDTNAHGAPQRTRGIRVKLKANKAVIDYHKKFRIKKLTPTYMNILTESPIEPGGTFAVSIMLDDSRAPLELNGTVVSCDMSRGTDAQRFEVRIDFVSMEPDQKNLLTGFLRKGSEQS